MGIDMICAHMHHVICIYIYMYIYTCVVMYVYIYICVCVCVYITHILAEFEVNGFQGHLRGNLDEFGDLYWLDGFQ